MAPSPKILLFAAVGIAAFSLLLFIISVGMVKWLDSGNSDYVGLFQKCYGPNNLASLNVPSDQCVPENRTTQAGLGVFGILLLAAAIIVSIIGAITQRSIALFVGLGLMYFASMFVMATYATWGHYSRDTDLYFFPRYQNLPNLNHTHMGDSYHLSVASHYFLWTALTILAFAVGALSASSESAST